MPVDYYGVLGVSKDADVKQIKEAYKELAKKYHPDTSSEENAEDRMKEINEAYSTLQDPQKRQQYDFQCAHGDGQGNGFNNWADVIFGNNFSFNPFKQTQRTNRNSDIFIEYGINVVDSLNPITIDVQYEKTKQCVDCSGVGGYEPTECDVCKGKGVIQTGATQGFMSFVQSRPCGKCRGTGKMYKKQCDTCNSFGLIKETVTQKCSLPLGCVGKRFMFENGGNQENPTVKPGNLILEIGLNPDPVFRFQSYYCAVCQLHLNPVEAMLGGEYKIKSIEGQELTANIPKGCSPGYQEEFKGMGIPYDENNRGSLICEVVYDIPNDVSPEQEKILREYLINRKEVS